MSKISCLTCVRHAAGVVTLFLALPANAQDVLLDIEVTMGGGEARSSQLELTFDEETPVPVNGDHRLVVVPTMVPSGLRFSFKLYGPDPDVEEPISSPVLEVPDGRQARLAQGTEPPGPSSIAIQLIPHLQ